MSEPTAALQAVRASTADLLKGLDEARWSDDDLRAESLCDGWTRGHVLTHLARNADGITATLSGALRGEVVPRYPEGDAGRTADIEAGAGRPVVEIIADIAQSAERLDRVFGGMNEAGAWDAPTDGRVAREWVLRRLCEVEVHRVDLAGSYGPDRWPPLLIGELLPILAESVSEHLDESLRLVVADGSVVPSFVGREWTIGSREPIVRVHAPDWALLAWLTGRGAIVADLLGDVPAAPPWR